MNYRLSVENETYPVEDIHFLAESTLTREAIGKPFSFVSPIPLTIGSCYKLRNDSVGYQLLINACLGFTYLPRFFVSGVIVTKEAAMAGAS